MLAPGYKKLFASRRGGRLQQASDVWTFASLGECIKFDGRYASSEGEHSDARRRWIPETAA
jgi:hypothetical protein